MRRIEGRVVFESHPGSARQWRFTPDAIADAARQMVGLPVTVNYDPERVIGRVTEAVVDTVGVSVVIDAVDSALPSDQDGLRDVSLGPGCVIEEGLADDLTGVLMVDRATLYELGILPNREART